MSNEQILAEAASADSAALRAAAVSAEEALACHRDALAALAVGWRSQTGSAATDSLHQQCAHADDVVAELHRAAAELALLRDSWTNSAERPGEPPPAEAPGPQPPTPVPVHSGAAPAPVADPPAAAPIQPATEPWATQAPATSWAAPQAAVPPTPPAWQPGGSVPALPDFGGALVGLVAQIAQTLGSYSDPPATPSVPLAGEAAATDTKPHPKHRKPPVTKSAAVPGPSPSAVPKSAVAQPQTIVPPTVPPSELLAAERPPDPVPPAPALEPPPPAPEPPPPAPEPPPPPPAPVVPTTDADTPCEIAADELPKVGE